MAKPSKSLRPFYAVLGQHREQLERIAARRVLPGLRKLYDEAHDEVARRLKARLRARLGDTFTAHQQRVVLAQLRQGQIELAGRMAGEISGATKEAQTDAVRGLAKDVSRLEKHFTGAEISLPIDEAWRLRSLVGKRRVVLDDMHKRSLARWGARLFADVHERTSMAIAAGLTTDQAIEMVPREAAEQWWQGERIVRTETAWAWNMAHADALQESREILPDLMKRWTEHVDDATGAPLDARVAPDSIAMHGQVTDPGGAFFFPSDAEGMTAKEIARMQERAPWAAPPNRPNDRATLEPWRPGWGIPAWRFSEGRREWL